MKLCRWIGCISLIGLIAGTAGCARSPRVTFYTLEPNAATRNVLAGRFSHAIAIGRVTVPDVVDRQQLVVRGEGNRLKIVELHRWAAPLKSEISRLIADDLGRLLGSDRISVYPQSAGNDADLLVLVDIRRFDATVGEGVTVEAVWRIRPMAGGAAKMGRSHVRERIGDDGYDAVVAAYGRALTAISGEIARAVSGEKLTEPPSGNTTSHTAVPPSSVNPSD